jgi:hypothetical protein
MAEGDVDGIMERPDGNSEQDQRAREKWYVGHAIAYPGISPYLKLTCEGMLGNNKMAYLGQKPNAGI